MPDFMAEVIKRNIRPRHNDHRVGGLDEVVDVKFERWRDSGIPRMRYEGSVIQMSCGLSLVGETPVTVLVSCKTFAPFYRKHQTGNFLSIIPKKN